VPSAIERFEEAARAAGLALEIRRFPQGTKTAADAARAIGCDIGQIVKSLVFVADGRPFLALTSGSNRADPGRLAKLLGSAQVRRATAEEAREATGYAIGGTPPFGHPGSLRVLVDRDLPCLRSGVGRGRNTGLGVSDLSDRGASGDGGGGRRLQGGWVTRGMFRGRPGAGQWPAGIIVAVPKREERP
jgi:prolyl-tRNA editing enzyme YbaK/EbsC (Cys-tRNA(Pro) deacylase)